MTETFQRSNRARAAPACISTLVFREKSDFHLGQTARLTNISLILPIAFVGLRPFGHTSTQFIMEWHLNSL